MFPPAPNEKKRGSTSIIARIFYFLVGLVLGAFVVLGSIRYYYLDISPLVSGLIILFFGFLGLLFCQKIYKGFDVLKWW